MKTSTRYSPQLWERAVRLVVEHQGAHDPQCAAIVSVSAKIGCSAQTLRQWIGRAEVDEGVRRWLTSAERERLKALERENRELRTTNETLRKASAYFAPPLGDCTALPRRATGVRGRRVKTTPPVATLGCPADRVNRVFRATRPNALWLAELTDVATWAGFVHVAFVIDAYARRIVGWRVSNSLRTDVALDALERALDDRAVNARDALVHHGGRGSQYLSIRDTERLAEAGIEQSVGSVGDSYDNALAQSIIGLYKTEVIQRRGPWRGLEPVEFATLEWVDWFNNRRRLEVIANRPPAEAQATYHRQSEHTALAA